MTTELGKGALARELWSYDFGVPVETPALADVDRDGNIDILVPTGDSRLHCLTRDTSPSAKR